MKVIHIMVALALLIGLADAGTLYRPDQINTSQPFPSITMDEGANITLDGGLIKNLQTDGIHNPMAYGAIPGDSIDDAEYFQDAIDAASSNGGGVVIVPPGEFLLNSSQYGGGFNDTILLKPRSNVYIVGFGSSSILKVGDNYRQQYRGCCPVFEGDTAIVDNWGIHNLKIDFNGQNNYVQSGWKESEFSAIGALSASNVTFSDLILENCSGQNVIYLTGSIYQNTSNAKISGIIIRNSGNDVSTSSTLTDFSAIYTSIENCVVENCVVEGSLAFREENACAIELHGPNSTADSNFIRNYRNGIYISSSGKNEYDTSPFGPMVCTGNRIMDAAYHGILCWLIGYNFTDVVITDNVISMNPMLDAPGVYGISHTFEEGITHTGGSTDSLVVTNNIIRFPAIANVNLSASVAYGITYSNVNNTTISRNEIFDASAVGIFSTIDLANGYHTVNGNSILNSGLTTNASIDLKAGLVCKHNAAAGNIAVIDNTIRASATGLTPAIYVYSPTSKIILGYISRNAVWGYPRDVWPDTMSASSAILIEDWGSAAPVSGTYQVGSKRWNTAPSAAGALLWACTTGGTPGTWKPCNLSS